MLLRWWWTPRWPWSCYWGAPGVRLRANLTAYVALAEVLECPLVPFDGALSNAPGHTAWVLVPEVLPS
jgi:hypothetical protein